MGLMRDLFNNTRKPEGFLGKMMVQGMNKGHAGVSDWGMAQLPALDPGAVIDLGCGGGRNAAQLMKRWPGAKLTALDYSDISLEKTRQVNRAEIAQGRCEVVQGDVSHLAIGDGQYEVATAFETVYFWPGPVKSFREVCRVLKSGGYFLVVNESDGENEKDEKWTELIDGMTIYSQQALCGHLKEAGFGEVSVFRKPENHWIAFLARKD